MGIGRVAKLCSSLCTELYDSCRQDFFEHLAAGELVACKPNSYVCSTLSEFASSSAQLCKELGLLGGEGLPCYDGNPSRMTASCLAQRNSTGNVREVSEMKFTQNTLDKIERIAEESGYVIRYERGSFQSGYCILQERKVVVLNKFLQTEGRINTLIDLLPQLEINFDALTLESQKLFTEIQPLVTNN